MPPEIFADLIRCSGGERREGVYIRCLSDYLRHVLKIGFNDGRGCEGNFIKVGLLVGIVSRFVSYFVLTLVFIGVTNCFRFFNLKSKKDFK